MLYDHKRWDKKVKAKTLSQIYSEAADAIRDHGHSRGELRAKDGGMCIWGAINFVTYGHLINVSKESMAMLPPLSRIVGRGVIGWNNEDGRTKRQVIGLLRKAARQQI